MTLHHVTAIPVGRGEVPGPEVFWMSHWDDWLPLTFQVMLLRSDGVTALVNTGPGADLTAMNQGWEAFLGPRAAMQRTEDELLLPQLERLGVAPHDVTHVILTPLQLYTVGDLLSFPAAEICLSRRGWEHYHTSRAHPHDDRWTSIPAETLVELVTNRWPDVRLLDDEDEVVPGIRTWWSGAHHRASICVEVDTDKGVVTISDSFFYARNVTEDHPIGICENIYEALSCHRRVRETADVILPLYDPANLEWFPGGVVA